MDRIGLAWELSSVTGWGLYGLQITLQALRRPDLQPVLFKLPSHLYPGPLAAAALAPVLAGQRQWLSRVQQTRTPQHVPFPVLKTLTSEFSAMGAGSWFFGEPDVGVVFFENPRLSAETVARARALPRIVVGSSWNAAILADHGLNNVSTVLQGVDLRRFHPRPGPKLLPGRFVVFSGGKLEHRKGQDIVLAAFQRFRSRHPEALLVTAWQSPWPEKARTVAQSLHVQGSPDVREKGGLDIVGWCAHNGLPAGSVVDLGMLPNHRIPDLLADVDCAVFASRYESGTNLPAMECMAMGLPVVLSDNTGHQDIIDDAWCYPLRAQGPVAPPAGWGNDGWGESSVDELDAALEAIFSDREAAASRGQAAAARMTQLAWPDQVDALLKVVAETAG